MKSFDQNTEIKVSVVVVTYNHEKTIARTLDSILAQERDFPMEIIIGDDASTDATESICREYVDKHPDLIKYIRNEKNKGVMDNYYDCLLLAKGKYIADVAGDDFWIYPRKLKEQVEILDKEDAVTLVCTDWKYFREDIGQLQTPWHDNTYPYKNIFEEKSLTAALLNHLTPVAVHSCTALYRKEAFLRLYEKDSYPFRNKEFIVEDLQLIVLLSTIGEFRFLDIPTLAYSVSSGSLTGTRDFQKVFDLYLGILKLTHFLAERTGVEIDKMSDVYSRLIHFIVMQAFHSEDFQRMQQIKSFVKDKRFPISFKTQIVLNLSFNSKTWGVSRKLWNFYRKRFRAQSGDEKLQG